MSSGSAIELLRGFARAETKSPERNGASGRQAAQEFASLLEGSRARRAREPERKAPAAESGGRTEKRRAQAERRRDDLSRSDDAALMYPANEGGSARAGEAAPAEAASAPVAGAEAAASPAGATAGAAEAVSAADVAAGPPQAAVTPEKQTNADGLLRLVQISRAAAEALRTAPVSSAAPVEGEAHPVAEPTAPARVPVGVAAEPTRVTERGVREASATVVPVVRPVTERATDETAATTEGAAERAAAPERPVETAPRAAGPVRPAAPIEQAVIESPAAASEAANTPRAEVAAAAAPVVDARRVAAQRRGESARIEARILSERAEAAESSGGRESEAVQVARALIERVEARVTDGALQELRRERIESGPGIGDGLNSRADSGLGLRPGAGGAVEAGGAKAGAQPLDLRAELAAPERTAAVEQIVEAARAQVGARRSQVTLQLEPPELGRLRIEVQVRDSAIGIQVRAESRVAQELLQSRMGELRRALESQGMTLDRAHVELRSPEQTSSGQTHERGLEQQTAFEQDGASGRGGEQGRAAERGDGQADARTPVETAEAVRIAAESGEAVVSVSNGINVLV